MTTPTPEQVKEAVKEAEGLAGDKPTVAGAFGEGRGDKRRWENRVAAIAQALAARDEEIARLKERLTAAIQENQRLEKGAVALRTDAEFEAGKRDAAEARVKELKGELGYWKGANLYPHSYREAVEKVRELQAQTAQEVAQARAQGKAEGIKAAADLLERPVMVFAFDNESCRADVIRRVRALALLLPKEPT